MATVSMDLEEFNEKLEEASDSGFECGKDFGVSKVMKWLESGKKLVDYLDNDFHTELNYLTKEEDGSIALKTGTHWERILKELEKRGFKE